jgi:hypothetical protein
MSSKNTVPSYILDWRKQQRAMRKRAQERIRENKPIYDYKAENRKWLRKYKYKPIIIYTMDKLQNTIVTKYDELDPTDQQKYLQESIEWHRQVAHYHMYMERNFAKQLEEHTPDSATSLAKPDEAEPELATATEAE